jgi:hypothetical protein
MTNANGLFRLPLARRAVVLNQFNARVFLLLMAARLVGDYVYAWGGEEAEEGGYDCSGFASTVLTQTARAWPMYDNVRRSAQGLFEHFDGQGCPDITDPTLLTPGCLVFHRTPGHEFTHVAIHATTVPMISLNGHMKEVGPVGFEAGGGGEGTDSPRAALRASAGIRLTASDHHGGKEWVAKDPFVLLG